MHDVLFADRKSTFEPAPILPTGGRMADPFYKAAILHVCRMVQSLSLSSAYDPVDFSIDCALTLMNQKGFLDEVSRMPPIFPGEEIPSIYETNASALAGAKITEKKEEEKEEATALKVDSESEDIEEGEIEESKESYDGNTTSYEDMLEDCQPRKRNVVVPVPPPPPPPVHVPLKRPNSYMTKMSNHVPSGPYTHTSIPPVSSALTPNDHRSIKSNSSIAEQTQWVNGVNSDYQRDVNAPSLYSGGKQINGGNIEYSKGYLEMESLSDSDD